ncbi:MAG: tetraacyldisaccharide 4'-kinase [Alphaproteobacteria bacterium]|nr:tetraacyldisaccharide 4'-kinase [Alphaproteobacteria bacterium]
MTFKTPAFWYRKPESPAPLTERLLAPLARLYALGHRFNQSLKPKPYKATIPVLCVGNAVAGGSGKTPAALALMELIKEHNLAQTPYFLSRGYGGRLKGPAIVDPLMKAEECGDEPLLLARAAPVVIAAKRPAGARFAHQHGAGLILMDDGLQNVSLSKDISFLVIDGAAGFGNEKLLPAGPLREPLHEAFTKADAFILIGKDARNVTSFLPPQKPLFHAHIEALLPPEIDPAQPVIAFAGLGRPEKFYRTLEKLGLSLAGWHPFPDHHLYTKTECAMLARESLKQNAPLVTTEKDAMRLKESGMPLHTIPIHLRFEDPARVLDFLKEQLKVSA